MSDKKNLNQPVPLNEGIIKKNVNLPPSTARPDPPKAQVPPPKQIQPPPQPHKK